MPEYIPLAFGIECLYPPQTFTATSLRDFYVSVAEPCRFTEYRQLAEGQGARLASGSNRHLTLQHDRFSYRDNNTSSVFDTFAENVEYIGKMLKEHFKIPVLLHTKVMIQVLMPHAGNGDTKAFLQSCLIGPDISTTDSFNRPLSGAGLRFVFPPTQAQHSTFHLRIEPYFPDLKMFFIENNAQFFDPLVNVSDIKSFVQPAYDFINEEAGPFVLSLSESQSGG